MTIKAILQFVVLFLIIKMVLAQPYMLRARDINPAVLYCYDSSTGFPADIDDVKFWRNRILPTDQGMREKGDVHIVEDQAENEIAFIVTREFEGRYTCGRLLIDTGTVVESPPVFLVCKFSSYIIMCLSESSV